jgi:hypothetical protein
MPELKKASARSSDMQTGAPNAKDNIKVSVECPSTPGPLATVHSNQPWLEGARTDEVRKGKDKAQGARMEARRLVESPWIEADGARRAQRLGGYGQRRDSIPPRSCRRARRSRVKMNVKDDRPEAD